jgi:hypothetical protein
MPRRICEKAFEIAIVTAQRGLFLIWITAYLKDRHIIFRWKQSETSRARRPREDPPLLLVETDRCVEMAQ